MCYDADTKSKKRDEAGKEASGKRDEKKGRGTKIITHAGSASSSFSNASSLKAAGCLASSGRMKMQYASRGGGREVNNNGSREAAPNHSHDRTQPPQPPTRSLREVAVQRHNH